MPLLLSIAARGLVEDLAAALDEGTAPGMTPSLLAALQALGGGCSIAELGRRLGIAKQSAGRSLRALEELGYAEIAPDGRDARAAIVRRTARGRAAVEASDALAEELVRGWRAQAGDAAVDGMLALLYSLERDRRSEAEAEA